LLTLTAALVLGDLRALEDAGPVHETPISAEDRDHWAFRALAAVTPPAVKDGSWPHGDLDRFILARLESRGLAPLPPAGRVTLIRRVTFDLTGLPPSPREVAAFLEDDSPDAYEKLVDRLLASPDFGERRALFWLDLSRFAETDGFEHDKLRPNAWRYRDWVIGALSTDMPYDEFAALQVAGDELRRGDAGAAVATGFALCGPDMPDINLVEERRHMVLNELTGTVGSVFLGLQMACAQCHDHKIDPISQADFYRLRAIFEPALVFDDQPLPVLASDARRGARKDGKKRSAGPAGRVLHEKPGKSPRSYLHVRGDFRRPGPEVKPALPRIANPRHDRIAWSDSPVQTSGRRSSFASWLTRGDNFLATRVIANRVWQEHFGHGLVTTPSDFGIMGQRPSHPMLLDWLARRTVAEGWSLKRVRRLLLLSATYRTAAVPGAGGSASSRAAWPRLLEADPGNRLLGRTTPRRLEGETLRDALLSVAGRLSLRREGGPGVMLPLPQEVRDTLLRGQWKVSPSEESHRRRSVYLFVRRNLRYPLFEVFDRPDGNASCARRDRSTTAPQALTLLNSELSLDLARRFAGRVLADAGDARAAWVERAYRLALGRGPRDDERRDALGFLDEQARRIRRVSRSSSDLATPLPAKEGSDAARGAALVDLCLALFNVNEFLYVD